MRPKEICKSKSEEQRLTKQRKGRVMVCIRFAEGKEYRSVTATMAAHLRKKYGKFCHVYVR